MFAEIDDRFGRIDVLVNNAGIAGSYGTLDSYTVEALDRLWAVNLTGPFVCAREAAHRMRADWARWLDHQHLIEGCRARRSERVGALRGVEGRHRHA